MVAGLAEHQVVDQCDLVGSDHKAGSNPVRYRPCLLLGQAAHERLGCLPLVGGLVDVGRHDQERDREPFEERPARRGAGTQNKPMHRRTGIDDVRERGL